MTTTKAAIHMGIARLETLSLAGVTSWDDIARLLTVAAGGRRMVHRDVIVETSSEVVTADLDQLLVELDRELLAVN